VSREKPSTSTILRQAAHRVESGLEIYVYWAIVNSLNSLGKDKHYATLINASAWIFAASGMGLLTSLSSLFVLLQRLPRVRDSE
jgi:hypothetical protein